MPLRISEYTDRVGIRRLLFETPEGMSYTRLRDQAFSDTWEATPDAGARVAVAEPPSGRSIALAMGMALSWDGTPVDVEWFIRAPNGTHRSLGTTNILAGETANAIYLLSVMANPVYYVTYTAEMVLDRGALCVTTSDDCGIYVTGWII